MAASTAAADSGGGVTGTGWLEVAVPLWFEVEPEHATSIKEIQPTASVAAKRTLWTLAPQPADTHVSTPVQPGADNMSGMSPIRHSDVELHCNYCGDRFVYSAGEQELLAVRGVSRQPSECPACRKLLGRGV
jgi:hypothetical protein